MKTIKLAGLIILLITLFTSCGSNKKQEFTYVDLSNASTLDSPETLFEFYDKHPVDVCVKDSVVFIQLVQSDTCVAALSLNSRKIISLFGIRGSGSDEVYGPEFIKAIGFSDVLMEDGNRRKILKIEPDKVSGTFSLKKYIDYPSKLKINGDINFSQNFIIGYMVKGTMFDIYNRNTDSILHIESYPTIFDSQADKHLFNIYSPSLGLNEEKNRIIAGMYMFDIFHLYDLEGQRIESFRFSEKYIPDTDMNDMQQSVDGFFPQVFPTNDYCYLMRMTQVSNDERTHIILKVNWDGKLINAYKIPEMYGRFCVDEKEKKLYAIRHYVNEKDEEIFAIVSYRL
jgi:hypothetical protein